MQQWNYILHQENNLFMVTNRMFEWKKDLDSGQQVSALTEVLVILRGYANDGTSTTAREKFLREMMQVSHFPMAHHEYGRIDRDHDDPTVIVARSH